MIHRQFMASVDELAKLVQSVALLKRNALAAPFERAFSEQKTLEGMPAPTDGSPPAQGDLMEIHYRDEEAIYVRASQDRVTVVFSTVFREETDRVFGKVFLQEFVDARRQAALQNAPQVLYSNRDPPLEIRHLRGLKSSEDIGYVTFGVFLDSWICLAITNLSNKYNLQYSSLATSHLSLPKTLSHGFSSSETIFIITLSALRRTCTVVCDTVYRSSSRSSIGLSKRTQARRSARPSRMFSFLRVFR